MIRPTISRRNIEKVLPEEEIVVVDEPTIECQDDIDDVVIEDYEITDAEEIEIWEPGAGTEEIDVSELQEVVVEYYVEGEVEDTTTKEPEEVIFEDFIEELEEESESFAETPTDEIEESLEMPLEVVEDQAVNELQEMSDNDYDPDGEEEASRFKKVRNKKKIYFSPKMMILFFKLLEENIDKIDKRASSIGRLPNHVKKKAWNSIQQKLEEKGKIFQKSSSHSKIITFFFRTQVHNQAVRPEISRLESRLLSIGKHKWNRRLHQTRFSLRS